MPDGDSEFAGRARPRVVKPPAVRRAELIDCAQRLFLAKGYDKTTINDVIAATALSKGAFYHHFRAKEDLLEAIAARFAAASLSDAAALRAVAEGGALARLNAMLAMGREWKVEHIPELKAMFVTLLRPENAVLYQRIVNAVFEAMAPVLAELIAEGAREGAFDVADARAVADALLWIGVGRRAVVIRAMEIAEAGDVDAATNMVVERVRAEEQIVERILGLPPGGVTMVGPVEDMKRLIQAWVEAGG
jgi:AcrR family transcriptional regulator